MTGTWRMAALAALVFAAPAHAAEPNRLSLSYEDNVTINEACFAAHAQGNDAFDACVATQMAELKDHPAPNQTALTPDRALEIARDCAWLRRVDLGQYNDCLTQKMADAPPPADPAASDGIASGADLAKAMTEPLAPADASVEEAADVRLPLPQSFLPKRPDHIGIERVTGAELYKKLERSVFVVGAARSLGDARARDILQGSAIAIAPHLLLTNCHVVDHRPLIVLLQGNESYHARVVAADTASDRCV